jgi:outer membrane receptor protein involved in Fe transport
VQFGAAWNQSEVWSLNLSVVGEDATVAAAAAAPSLVGNQLPEVPRWNASLGLTWHPAPRVFLTARIRRTGSQFDDDQNRLPLASATVADASLRVVLAPHAEVFLSVDNLADAQVETAHSAAGVFNVAPPRLAGAGARVSW